jgi:tetratricopeptide (TPR) repeat protein
MKLNIFLLILVVFSVLPIAGCIQGQATVSLNPDGSGKIFIETVIDPCGSGKSGDIWKSYRDYLTQIKETLMQSEGIDAWSDVDWKVLPNGKYYFTGRAWFKSIDKVAFHLGQFRGNLTAYLEDANGINILGLKSLRTQVEEKAWEKTNSALRYKLFSSDMTGILGGLRLDLIFILPGSAEKIIGFEKIDEKTIHFLIAGRRMAYLLEYIKQNGLYQLADRWNYDKVEFLNNEMLPMYLEKAGPVSASFAGGSNLFEYEKEQAAVKKDIVRIIDKLDGDMVEAKLRQQSVEEKTAAEPNTQEKTKIEIEPQFRSALIHEYRNDYDEAIKIYGQIIDSNQAQVKDLAQAHYRMGLCYFEAGDNKNALKQFEYVIMNYPSQRLPAVRSSNMIRDIQNGSAVRKAEKNKQGPTIVRSSPELYMQDVNSLSVESITINFSKEMDPNNWFYSSFGPGKLPEITGTPMFDASGKSWTLPVKLEKSQVYAIAFNSGDAASDKMKPGFRDINGKMCKPFVLVFATMNDANEPTDIDVKLIDKSAEIDVND